jgi:hypothetical protein
VVNHGEQLAWIEYGGVDPESLTPSRIRRDVWEHVEKTLPGDFCAHWEKKIAPGGQILIHVRIYEHPDLDEETQPK